VPIELRAGRLLGMFWANLNWRSDQIVIGVCIPIALILYELLCASIRVAQL
jgi:hypothetical protein